MAINSAQNRSFPWLLMVFALPVFAVLLALGTWQVQRLAWKQELLATIAARTDAPAEPLAKVITNLREGQLAAGALEYMPAAGKVVFMNEREQHFFATHRGRSGYYVYTPAIIPDLADAIVFINRGFVPFDLKEPELRPDSLIEGPVTVEGLLRQMLPEKPSFVTPENDPVGNIWYWKDLVGMSAAAGLARDSVVPFFLDAGFPDQNYPQDKLPVPGVTLIELPNNHLQYAVTWYGFALTLSVIVGMLVRRRLIGSDA